MKTTEVYEAPVVEVIEVEVEKGFAMSGQGTDTNNDYDFGGRGANERRGEWGNLWEHKWELVIVIHYEEYL